VTACIVSCSRRFRPTATSFELLTEHAHQHFYVSILWSSTSSFFSEFGNNCLERNITEQITMCNWEIRTESLTLCQFRIRKVISEKISTLMGRTLPRKYTKLGAKIFRNYWVIIFLVLGHFLKPHPVVSCHMHQLLTDRSTTNVRRPVKLTSSPLLQDPPPHLSVISGAVRDARNHTVPVISQRALTQTTAGDFPFPSIFYLSSENTYKHDWNNNNNHHHHLVLKLN